MIENDKPNKMVIKHKSTIGKLLSDDPNKFNKYDRNNYDNDNDNNNKDKDKIKGSDYSGI